MDKDEVLKQLAELKQKAEQLEKEVNTNKIEIVRINARWQPILGQYYFYLDDFGGVQRVKWEYDDIDFHRYNIGNCFKTEQEAEDYKENLLTKQELKDLALGLNVDAKIDWSNTLQHKYQISLDKDDTLYQSFLNSSPALGQVYCLDQNFLEIAKKRIGKKKLIKLIKSGI